MDSVDLAHLVSEKGVYHPMAGGGVPGAEGLGNDDEPGGGVWVSDRDESEIE